MNTSRPFYDPSWDRDADADETLVPLADQQEAIKTREDLVAFVQALRKDFEAHSDWWQNRTLDGYLSAIAAVIEDLEQGFRNRGDVMPQQPTWTIVGDILLTARIYE